MADTSFEMSWSEDGDGRDGGGGGGNGWGNPSNAPVNSFSPSGFPTPTPNPSQRKVFELPSATPSSSTFLPSSPSPSPSPSSQFHASPFPGMAGGNAPPFNNIYAQLAGNFAEQNLQVGKDYLQQNVNQYISIDHLRFLFEVDTSYVTRKMRLLFFPFLHGNWNRRLEKNEKGMDVCLPPRLDINAPDLYIPTMAFIT